MSCVPTWSFQYAITLTLKPTQYKKTPEEQYRLLEDALFEINHKCKSWLKMDILCELTKNYNIHAHGIFIFNLGNHKLKHVHNLFRDSKIFGFIYIKPIDNYNVWYDYITKSRLHFLQQMDKCVPIILNELGTLDPLYVNFEGTA